MNLAVLLPDIPRRRGASLPRLDYALLTAVVALFSLGLVMVASASMPVAERGEKELPAFAFTYKDWINFTHEWVFPLPGGSVKLPLLNPTIRQEP